MTISSREKLFRKDILTRLEINGLELKMTEIRKRIFNPPKKQKLDGKETSNKHKEIGTSRGNEKVTGK